jgi:hypothetical protein
MLKVFELGGCAAVCMAHATVHAPRFKARAVAVAKHCHPAPSGAEHSKFKIQNPKSKIQN